jgi:hypothetical protein
MLDIERRLRPRSAVPTTAPATGWGDRGGRHFAWMSVGTEGFGPEGMVKPPARSREVVAEMFDVGAVIAGRRTFDLATASSNSGRHSCSTASAMWRWPTVS